MNTIIFTIGLIAVGAILVIIFLIAYQFFKGYYQNAWEDFGTWEKIPFRNLVFYSWEYVQVWVSNVLYKCFIWHYNKIYANETNFHADLEILDELLLNSNTVLGKNAYDFFALEDYFQNQIGRKCRQSREFEETLIDEIKSEGFAVAIYNSLG